MTSISRPEQRPTGDTQPLHPSLGASIIQTRAPNPTRPRPTIMTREMQAAYSGRVLLSGRMVHGAGPKSGCSLSRIRQGFLLAVFVAGLAALAVYGIITLVRANRDSSDSDGYNQANRPTARPPWGEMETTTWRSPWRNPANYSFGNSPCGEVRVLPKVQIIGGSEARTAAYPWLVMMLVNGKFTCGGSILDRWNILTAAHCLENEPKDYLTGLVDTSTHEITIVAGKHSQETATFEDYEQSIPAKTAIMHPKFSGGSVVVNDVAVIRLSLPLQLNTRVSPLCLPSASSPLPAVCTVAGWGLTDVETQDQPTTLRQSTIFAYNRSRCEDTFKSTFRMKGHPISYYLMQGIMCTANGTFGGTSACFGDSGSPVFCLAPGSQAEDKAKGVQRYTQFGIVSWGDYCGSPSFHTFVPHFIPWLTTEALPSLDKYSSSSDSVCQSFSPLYSSYLSSCRSSLEQLRRDTGCRNITAVVSCVVYALQKYDHHCSAEEVYNTIVTSSSMAFTTSQRLQCQEHFQLSEVTDPECLRFSPTNLYTFSKCQSDLNRIQHDPQCRNVSWVVTCLANVLQRYGHHCPREQVLTTLLSAPGVTFTSQQRYQCQVNGQKSVCDDLTIVSSALTACTRHKPCVSVQEVSVCVHAVVDPSWLQCSLRELQTTITTRLSASLAVCQDYTLRTMTDGRHFMNLNGDWLALCSGHWGQAEVNVVCKQRGFKAGKASYIHRAGENIYVFDRHNSSFDPLRYIKASGWMEVTCSGSESSLEECSLQRQITCSSSYIAASVCYNTAYEYQLDSQQPAAAYGRVDLTRDQGQGHVCVPDLSDRAAHLLCREAGYVGGMAYNEKPVSLSDSYGIWETVMQCDANDVDVNACTHGIWQYSSPQGLTTRSCFEARVFCFPHKARLHNGLFNTTGIVQLYRPATNGHDVTLSTVCREGFDDVAATIVCGQMGYSGHHRSLPFNAFFRPNSQYVSVNCKGTESRLEDCHVRGSSLPTCTAPAVVQCHDVHQNTEPDLTAELYGADNHVRIFMDGQQGTICTDHWTDLEAAALCRQLGRSYGYRHLGSFEANARREVPHVLRNVRCGKGASSVRECSYDRVTSDSCQHAPAAAVLCSDHPLPVYSLDKANHANSTNKRVVHVTYNGTTAPLSGFYGISSNQARVLCRYLGYVDGENDYSSSSGSNEPGLAVSWVLDAASYSPVCTDFQQCLSGSLRLTSCADSPYLCRDMATVVCYPSVRLHTGAQQTTGIVQLYRNGSWWEVCRDDITQAAADVICHDVIGSPTASAIILRDVYRAGFYPQVKASEFCDPSDPGMTSSDCLVLDLTSTCESFNNDPAAVVCYDGTRPSGEITDWKQVYVDPGYLSSYRLVMVKRYGQWGTVCVDRWKTQQADFSFFSLFCRHLGYHGRDKVGTKTRDSTRPLWAWSIDCDVGDFSLDSCSKNLTSEVSGRCFFNQDAMVVCY